MRQNSLNIFIHTNHIHIIIQHSHAIRMGMEAETLSNSSSLFSSDALKKMFVHYVADIARRKNISIAAWEDGMYSEGEGPYMRDKFRNK